MRIWYNKISYEQFLFQYYADFILSQAHYGDNEYRIEKRDLYFECRYTPCTNMEQEPRQFSICGRCQVSSQAKL